MKRTRATLVALLILASWPSDASPQTESASPSLEFGIDASFWMSWPEDADRLTTIEIPFSRVRVGTYATRNLLVEIAGGFAYAEESDRSSSAGRAEGALSYHFTRDARRSRLYLLAGGGGRWATEDGTTSWQGYATAGLGLKLPVNRVVGVRIEGDYGRAFETGTLPAAHEVRGLLGISFYVGR